MKGPSGRHGQNVFMAMPACPEAAIQSWYDEICRYSWDCPGFKWDTGHFTQVVWRATESVGLACSSDVTYIVANYFLAGNVSMPGQFEANVPRLGSLPAEGPQIAKAMAGLQSFPGGQAELDALRAEVRRLSECLASVTQAQRKRGVTVAYTSFYYPIVRADSGVLASSASTGALTGPVAVLTTQDSCADSHAVVGDRVRWAGSGEVNGSSGAWTLANGEIATVVEVNSEGNLRLRNPSGQESAGFFLKEQWVSAGQTPSPYMAPQTTSAPAPTEPSIGARDRIEVVEDIQYTWQGQPWYTLARGRRGKVRSIDTDGDHLVAWEAPQEVQWLLKKDLHKVHKVDTNEQQIPVGAYRRQRIQV